MARIRGAGSLRQRRPGVWEVRVCLGPDAVSGRSVVQSVTVHGDLQVAEEARGRWAEAAALVRSRRQVWSGITLAELLGVWLADEHDWRPSTLVGYRSTAGFLARDRLYESPFTDHAPHGPDVILSDGQIEGILPILDDVRAHALVGDHVA